MQVSHRAKTRAFDAKVELANFRKLAPKRGKCWAVVVSHTMNSVGVVVRKTLNPLLADEYSPQKIVRKSAKKFVSARGRSNSSPRSLRPGSGQAIGVQGRCGTKTKKCLTFPSNVCALTVPTLRSTAKPISSQNRTVDCED